jgi:hypothetical protein
MASFISRALLIPIAAATCALVLIRPCLADPQPTSASSSAGPCTLLMGGGGTVTPDKDLNSHWVSLNSILARDLETALTNLGYRMQDFIVDIQDKAARAAALEAQVLKSGCGKVLQLTHELTSAPDKPGTYSKFTFVVSVSNFEAVTPSSKDITRAVRIAEKYEMAYEYAMTPKALGTLSFTDLAQSMAADVDKAGVLPK